MKRKNENNLLYVVFECKEDFDCSQTLLYIYKKIEEGINSLKYNKTKNLILAVFDLDKQNYIPLYANSLFALDFCDNQIVVI